MFTLSYVVFNYTALNFGITSVGTQRWDNCLLSGHPSLTTQLPYSKVNTYAASTDTVNSTSSVYKATAVSSAGAGTASFHAPSVNQYAASFSTYSGTDGSVSAHTTAATQYSSYAANVAPGFSAPPQMGGSTGGYGAVQSSQPVYGGSAHANKPYGTGSVTASEKQQSGMSSYQSGGLSQSYDAYQQLNSGQLAAGGGASSGSGYPLSGSAYQSGQLTYPGSSFQHPSVPAGYDLSSTSQLSGSTSYGSGHTYPPNLYSRQSRDSSVPGSSYTSGPDGYPRATQSYSSTAVQSSSVPAQSVSLTANKLADNLGKLAVKDAASVTVSAPFNSVQLTSSNTSAATLSTTATTAMSSSDVGFLPAAVVSSAAARTTSSVLSSKSSAPLTSKAIYCAFLSLVLLLLLCSV